jgi:hypothetical protein
MIGLNEPYHDYTTESRDTQPALRFKRVEPLQIAEYRDLKTPSVGRHRTGCRTSKTGAKNSVPQRIAFTIECQSQASCERGHVGGDKSKQRAAAANKAEIKQVHRRQCGG